jgi:fructose-specific phosphotransferase system component IIB
MSSKRNWILAAVMAVAVVIGYIALTGKAPMKTDTQGAIGAANRYQTQQIAAGDVSLKDAKIQAFLQTDLFHKVATNSKFRAAVTNPKFQALAKNPSFQKVADDGSMAEYLGRYKSLFEREDFDAMLATKKLQSVADMEKMVHVLQNKSFAMLASDQDFVSLLKDPNFDAVMEQAEIQKATTVKQLQEIEASKTVKLQSLADLEKKKAFAQLLADDVMQEAASQGELSRLADLLENTNVEAMLSDDSFQELLANPKALSFVTSEEMASLAESLETMAHEGSAAEFLAVVSDPSVAEAFHHPEMQEMANADLLKSAVAAVPTVDH